MIRSFMEQIPHWHPGADFSRMEFFIRRLDGTGSSRHPQVPWAEMPLTGFVWLFSGELLADVDGESFLCSAGHLLVIPKGRRFAVRHYPDASGFAGGFSDRILSAEGLKVLSAVKEPLQQAFWFDEALFVGELFNMLSISSEKDDRVFIEKGLDLLISRLNISSGVHFSQRVSSFLDAVFDTESVPGPESRYAAGAGVSLNYLNRIVKRETGRPVGFWIDAARVSRAKSLLRETSKSIIDIAAEIGIYDQAYFSRFFRSRTGMTPTAFRKMMHG